MNFEMCHLRSLGRVANFKNDAFPNGGIGFDLLASLTCCTCCRMIIRGGWGGVSTSLTSTSLTVQNMYTLHMLSYDHQGGSGGGGGGCINVLDEYFPCVTEHVHVAHAVV